MNKMARSSIALVVTQVWSLDKYNNMCTNTVPSHPQLRAVFSHIQI